MAKRMEILKEESEKHHFTNVWTTGGKVRTATRLSFIMFDFLFKVVPDVTWK